MYLEGDWKSFSVTVFFMFGGQRVMIDDVNVRFI